ncbi:hypothetical protein SLEP1_g54247 [Rubroshorea leprosula]|uniref:Protein kinase domain-containing protein n=1 Tax=Rubroshorea leprosula TaxID=152421 RepID=A0AAV5MBZ7_9ROSI|nr:hypothetical protein SLEP1_g54247 [Rubroshorea leprosula]
MPPAAVSLFLFLVLTSLEILLSAGEEERGPKNCPPFKCGNFTAPWFLSTVSGNLSAPGCGIFLIDGCNETVQKIQLEKGRGRWYTLEGMSQGERLWENNITIQDDKLLQSPDCQLFSNLPLSNSTGNSFRILSAVAILNCSKSHRKNAIPEYFTHINRSCNNRSVYYRIYDAPLDTNLNVPSTCSLVFDFPLKNLPSYNKDHFTPLPANLSIRVEIHLPGLDHDPDLDPDPCHVCRKDGGCSSHCSKNRKGKLALKLGVGFAVSTVVLIIMSILIVRVRSNEQNYGSSNLSRGGNVNLKKKYCNDIEAFLRSNGRLAPKRYSFKDVKKMTNKFRDKLGEGGFGAVYKGKLSDGCQVAVKVLNKMKDNGESFMNEVASISRTSHVNIVTLLGFCFEGHQRALVYKFMQNGSLEKFIHQENPLNADNQLKRETLYNIAVGIAKGLEYLHRGCNMRILHFDIKPHNILLDDDLCPKISDFGLAKLCPRKESMVSMTDARGTIGYIAPEVFFRSIGRVSHKSDVYSYGMMVLEMVGERENINAKSDHSSEYFPQWIYRRLELDEEPGIWSITNEDDKERARKMTIVGLWCIQTNPSDRPPMCRVLQMLQGNLNSLEIPPKPFFSCPPRLPTEADVSSPSSLIPSQIP